MLDHKVHYLRGAGPDHPQPNIPQCPFNRVNIRVDKYIANQVQINKTPIHPCSEIHRKSGTDQ